MNTRSTHALRRGIRSRLSQWVSLAWIGGLILGGCASGTPTPASTVAAASTPQSSLGPTPLVDTTPTASLGVEPQPAVTAGEIYTATSQLFSVPIPTNWQAREEDAIVHLSDTDGKIAIALLALEQPDLKTAIADAWAKVDPTFVLEPDSTEEPPSMNGVEQTLVAYYDDGDTSHTLAAMAQLHDGIAYVLLMDADNQALEKRAAQLGIIQSGLTILALQSSSLQGTTARPVDAAITAELEAFIEEQLARTSIPGANVAIVQNGKVVYANGFGVRDRLSGEPMTPDTHMMIGSTGKSLTTMLMATLVDDGLMTWDTPVVDILPSFRVKDPELSQKLTVRNMVCACTGVPRRDLEWMLNANELDAADVVESLATFEFFTEFGEAFQYSNQMVAVGGFVAGVAAGGNPDALESAYQTALQERVLDPIGMADTTLSFEVVESRNKYATPHGMSVDPSNLFQPLPLTAESLLTSMAPAGAHWSTVNDMAKYMITQLNLGTSPTGTQVVSAENLKVTREPQVPIDATTSYGLGWIVGSYYDLPMVTHGGNTFGFTSEFTFLPEQGLGIIVMTNAQSSNAFNESIRTRLFELVFGQESTAEQTLTFTLELWDRQRAELNSQITDTLDLEKVTPFLGSYQHETLGPLTLGIEHDELFIDVGEFRSVLKAMVDEDTTTDTYLLIDSLGAGTPMRLQKTPEGKFELVLESGLSSYTFERMP